MMSATAEATNRDSVIEQHSIDSALHTERRWAEPRATSEVAPHVLAENDIPSLTPGMMKAIEEEELLQEWERFLDVQTWALGESEVAWLRSREFGTGRGVLEVGSAAGGYGAFLARNFSGTRIFGVESNPHLARRFRRSKAAPPNYSIEVSKIGEDPIPKAVRGRFDRCVLRFVLQHVSDPARVLRAVHDALPVGGRIYVIEEDLSFLTTRPDWEPFQLTRDAWLRVTAAGGTDGVIGSKLPGLATEAGFTVDDLNIVLRNNVEMGTAFGDYLTSVIRLLQKNSPDLVTEEEVRTVVDGFEASRDDHAGHFVATYPQFLMMATKVADRTHRHPRRPGHGVRVH
ncbi:methyltransferase [Nonomuraea sp. B19D2]|uniref:methyltransferase n=1 Tax=Nonomuraea sp. B19D2 TaxID=3159561 RepID=UPI0032DB3CE0